MKKSLILLCAGAMIIAGFSCKKKEPQQPPQEQTTAPQVEQQQSEKQPEAIAAKLPVLQAGVQIMNGDQPLSIGHTASPEVVDWNNDGKKDLLVGTFENGRIMLFLNQGTDEKPVFDGGEFLTAAADEINVGYG